MKQPLPEKFGKFEVVREVGKGGFGVVYEGRDPVLKRRVAIKTCNTDDHSMRQRFQREAEIVASLQHPNITTVHDLGVQDEVPYLVQEYLSGQDLSQFIIQKKELPIRRRLEILRSVARGLEHAHKRGIVHRDIKPGNVRVLENGTVKVMDFGIAKLTASSETQLTQSGMMIGTAAYLAPEQVSDVEVDHRCDIFSFGVVAYELLTFQRPFAGTTISALLYKINHEEHTPLRANLPSAPAALSSLIDDCLAKEPDGRPISFTKVLERLDEVDAALTGDVQPIAAGGPEDATRVAGGPKSKATAEAMDLAAAATMVTPSGAGTSAEAIDPTAKTMLTPSSTDDATVIEPTTAERTVSESAMSQMFSNASKPSLIAVAVFALIAVGAVWFALSRDGGGASSEVADANPPAATAAALPVDTEDANATDVTEPAGTTDEDSGEPNGGAATVGGPEADAADPPAGRRSAPTTTRAEPEPSRQPARSPAAGSQASRRSQSGASAVPAESAGTRAAREPEPTAPPTRQAERPSEPVRRPEAATAASTDPPPPTTAAAVEARSEEPREPDPTSSATNESRPVTRSESSPARPNPSAPAGTTHSGPATAEPPAARPTAVDHRPALEALMAVYRAAMESQDGGALQRIWPSLTRRQLQRIEASFAATEAMEIEINDCRFDIAVPQAKADCRVERTITPRAGRRQSNTSRSTFSFRQENGKWVLTGV